MAISYEEMHGSPQESFDNTNGWTAIRQLRCDWDEREELVAELLYTEYDGIITGTGTIPGVIALTFSIAPAPGEQQGTGNQASYEKAIVTVNYGRDTQQGPDPDAGDYFEDFQPTGEFQTIDYRNLFWNEGAAPGVTVDDLVQITSGASLGKLFLGGDYILKRFGLETYPTDKLALIGKVNSNAVTPKTTYLAGIGTFAAETLLFQPPSMEYVLQPSGEYLINVTYRFNYKPETHNKFFYPGSSTLISGWYKPKTFNLSYPPTTAIDVYESTTFSGF
jgi:hypothetical protein